MSSIGVSGPVISSRNPKWFAVTLTSDTSLEPGMATAYDSTFFDWVDHTAARSAGIVVPLLQEVVSATSVVDVGCGRGTWLAAWRNAGVSDVLGLDGAYVDQQRLAIPLEAFNSADLAGSFTVGRHFDVAQSLEVAEHLPPDSGPRFVAQLCALADVVVFSAAQPGQGGEQHTNERPVSYWAGLFAAQGYDAFDAVRPQLAENADVDPWYRFNTVVYANAAGAARLSKAARAARVASADQLRDGGDMAWLLRRALLRPLPVSAVSALSRLRYTLATAAQRRRSAA
jgi:SAM-dependent methyltransferase